MDTATMVEEQLDEGQRFVDHLNQHGFDVVVALWVLTSEEGLWFLYIASEVVETDGLATAYRRAYAELSRSQVRWISRSDIKLIGSQNPIAVDAVAHQHDRLQTVYRGRQLGGMIVEEARIYPRSA
jgi:hypothetical protein